MGRPPKPANEKRQLVSVRLDPKVRSLLESAAQKSGRSLAGEIERRISDLAAVDEETLVLLETLAMQIRDLQQRNVGKRWHQDLKTWAAVAEMMALGPIRDAKPCKPADVEAQDDAYAPLSEINDRQRNLVRELSDLGILVSPEKRNPTLNRTGSLFGGFKSVNSRVLERGAIDVIPDDDIRARAIELHEQLVQLDEEQVEAQERYAEMIRPYIEEEAAGRMMYQDHLHDEAQRRRDLGLDYNYGHLLRLFSTWR